MIYTKFVVGSRIWLVPKSLLDKYPDFPTSILVLNDTESGKEVPWTDEEFTAFSEVCQAQEIWTANL